jgi:hypothetical protein
MILIIDTLLYLLEIGSMNIVLFHPKKTKNETVDTETLANGDLCLLKNK